VAGIPRDTMAGPEIFSFPAFFIRVAGVGCIVHVHLPRCGGYRERGKNPSRSGGRKAEGQDPVLKAATSSQTPTFSCPLDPKKDAGGSRWRDGSILSSPSQALPQEGPPASLRQVASFRHVPGPAPRGSEPRVRPSQRQAARLVVQLRSIEHASDGAPKHPARTGLLVGPSTDPSRFSQTGRSDLGTQGDKWAAKGKGKALYSAQSTQSMMSRRLQSTASGLWGAALATKTSSPIPRRQTDPGGGIGEHQDDD